MSQAPFTRHDPNICSHLASLISLDLDSDSQDIKVKVEQVDPGGPVSNGVSEDGKPKEVVDPVRARVEERYASVVRHGATSEGSKRRKMCAPECSACHSPQARPWACLTCPFEGCFSLSASSSSTKHCLQEHISSNSECKFAIDSTTGGIYCSLCDDVIYSDTFDMVYRSTKTAQEERSDRSREHSNIGRGRDRGSYRPWAPAPSTSLLDVSKTSCRGIRPLLNLSQTCFLSAILQALIHNPLLKAYFLSDKHNRHVCSNNSKGLAVGKPYMGPDGNPSTEREKGCMCCEMDRAFEEFHSEDKAPFGPITMLYAMWHASAELEGYGQQDAHSFFLAALDQIHAHARGTLSGCTCIAHQTFAGSLLSSVTCSKCQKASTTIDPILDVQLDFPSNTSDPSALTLTNMLRRFCAEEQIGDTSKGYDCSSCGGGPGAIASRRLLIKRLPPVLSFQLKRFAHNATSTKVELPVRFPSHLDMRPYVEPPPLNAPPLPDSLYAYDLFAVVTHEGKLDNGHYWADVLSGSEWWHCDDDKVTPTTLKSVLSQKAYMLFYVKRSLAYAEPMAKMLATSSANSVPTLSTTSGSNMNGTIKPANGTGGGSTVPPPLGSQNTNGSSEGAKNAAVGGAGDRGERTPKKGTKGLPKSPWSPYTGRGGHPINGMAI